MSELIVSLRKADMLEEGAPQNVYKVYIKAGYGERYIIKSGFGAFAVVTAKYLENGEEKERHWYKYFVLEPTEEMIFDGQTWIFLGHIIGEPDMYKESASLYNCEKYSRN